MFPEQIGHFILRHELGRGACGVVFHAVDQDDPTYQVAVKVLHPSLAGDAGFVAMLRQERDMLVRLIHPGVVQFRDLVLWPGGAALILEALDGESLERRLEQGPLALEEALSVLGQILEALAHAHEQQPPVVHRDLKPSNLFLTRSGRVKVLDFGLARAREGSTASQTGVLGAGTWSYMAPEVWGGQAATPASDVYAVGLIGWELLTGRPACPEGSLPLRMRWHREGALGDLRASRPELPAWVGPTLEELCARDLARRPKGARAALSLLERARQRGDADPPAGDPPGLRWRSRYALLPAGFLAVAALALVRGSGESAETATERPVVSVEDATDETPAPVANPALTTAPTPPPRTNTPALVPMEAAARASVSTVSTASAARVPPTPTQDLTRRLSEEEERLAARLVDGVVVTGLRLDPVAGDPGARDLVLTGGWSAWFSLLQAAAEDPSRQDETQQQRAALARLCAAAGEASQGSEWRGRRVVLEDAGACVRTMEAAQAREASRRLREAKVADDRRRWTEAVSWTFGQLDSC